MAIGNVVPVGKLPEGAIICNIEAKVGDRSALAKASGAYAIVVSHNPDTAKTRIKLPSGMKKSVPSKCRCMVGIISGGGRIEKPILKAGNNYFRFKAKRNCWPRVRGVAMSPVDHPHGGGNHQHIGFSCTVRRNAPPGQKVCLFFSILPCVLDWEEAHTACLCPCRLVLLLPVVLVVCVVVLRPERILMLISRRVRRSKLVSDWRGATLDELLPAAKGARSTNFHLFAQFWCCCLFCMLKLCGLKIPWCFAVCTEIFSPANASHDDFIVASPHQRDHVMGWSRAQLAEGIHMCKRCAILTRPPNPPSPGEQQPLTLILALDQSKLLHRCQHSGMAICTR